MDKVQIEEGKDNKMNDDDKSVTTIEELGGIKKRIPHESQTESQSSNIDKEKNSKMVNHYLFLQTIHDIFSQGRRLASGILVWYGKEEEDDKEKEIL